MNIIKIQDLNNFPLSDRHGSYGGMAGSKDGLLIDGEYWMVKYPKSTRGMRPPVPSYTSSPLSEYIGSHVYGILGYDVHETFLGFRNDKIVVACKDFCNSLGDLRERILVRKAVSKLLQNPYSKLEGGYGTVFKNDFHHWFKNRYYVKIRGTRIRIVYELASLEVQTYVNILAIREGPITS